MRPIGAVLLVTFSSVLAACAGWGVGLEEVDGGSWSASGLTMGGREGEDEDEDRDDEGDQEGAEFNGWCNGSSSLISAGNGYLPYRQRREIMTKRMREAVHTTCRRNKGGAMGQISEAMDDKQRLLEEHLKPIPYIEMACCDRIEM